MFPSASPRGTLRVSGKQNSLFLLGPVIKCLLTPKRKPPSFNNESENSLREKMDRNSSAGSTPKMDWSSGDLPSAWKAFKQHCEFTFGGPLKQKSEEVKYNYLMLWVGDKGREIYSTWELGAEEAKKLNTYYTKYEAYVKPKSSSTRKYNKRVHHL